MFNASQERLFELHDTVYDMVCEIYRHPELEEMSPYGVESLIRAQIEEALSQAKKDTISL